MHPRCPRQLLMQAAQTTEAAKMGPENKRARLHIGVPIFERESIKTAKSHQRRLRASVQDPV
eukprot:895000-Pyramimonas_sp.AAC.1